MTSLSVKRKRHIVQGTFTSMSSGAKMLHIRVTSVNRPRGRSLGATGVKGGTGVHEKSDNEAVKTCSLKVQQLGTW